MTDAQKAKEPNKKSDLAGCYQPPPDPYCLNSSQPANRAAKEEKMENYKDSWKTKSLNRGF